MMKEGQAYKRSHSSITMEIRIMENGRRIDKMYVADTVALREVMKKYSLRT